MRNQHVSVLSVVINGNYKDIIMKKYKVMAFECLGFMETIKAESKEEAIRYLKSFIQKENLCQTALKGLTELKFKN